MLFKQRLQRCRSCRFDHATVSVFFMLLLNKGYKDDNTISLLGEDAQTQPRNILDCTNLPITFWLWNVTTGNGNLIALRSDQDKSDPIRPCIVIIIQRQITIIPSSSNIFLQLDMPKEVPNQLTNFIAISQLAIAFCLS